MKFNTEHLQVLPLAAAEFRENRSSESHAWLTALMTFYSHFHYFAPDFDKKKKSVRNVSTEVYTVLVASWS